MEITIEGVEKAYMGIQLTTILTTVMVLKINHYLNACNKSSSSKKWDIVEWFFAVIFGWVGVVYILISYSGEIFSFCTKAKVKVKKEKPLKTEEEIRQEVEEELRNNEFNNSARKQRSTCKVKD